MSDTNENGFYFSVVKGKTKYCAMVKKEPFTCEHPNPVSEPGELWFEFGNTPEQALKKLKDELAKEQSVAWQHFNKGIP